MEFKPKEVICLAKSDSYKYTCLNIHLDSSDHEVCNTYRFNRGVPYLIKNQEDYDELVSLDMFEAYEETESVLIESGEEIKVETKAEKKAREKAERKAKKEAEELEKLSEENEVDSENEDEVPEVE